MKIKFKTMENTEVIFRKFKSGDIIALFPYEIADNKGNVLSYMHTGQHGGADYNGILYKTKPAKKDEYKHLMNELKSIGYNLKTLLRRNYNKYLKEYNKI